MLHTISTWFNSAQATAIVAFLITIIPMVWKLIKPIIDEKIKTEKNTQVKQGLELGEKLADTIVPEMAVMAGLSKSDRKKEAVRFVNANLTSQGFNFDDQTLLGLVEKAYQAYKQTGGDNHMPKTTEAPELITETMITPETNIKEGEANE